MCRLTANDNWDAKPSHLPTEVAFETSCPRDVEWLYHTGREIYVCCYWGWPLEFRGGSASPEMAPSPSNSSDTALNSSSACPDMIYHVLMAASIDHEGDQVVEHVVRNVPERGLTIAGNSREGGLAIDPGRGPPFSGI